MIVKIKTLLKPNLISLVSPGSYIYFSFIWIYVFFRKNINKKIAIEIFELLEIGSKEIVMSCGSSVSAASLALAYSLINNDYVAKIYVGSWTEFGKK